MTKNANSVTSQVRIDKLRKIFSTHGLPEKVVSDNGSTFRSHEFAAFMQDNGIVHVPATNGQAERAVQMVKQWLKKLTQGSLQARLDLLFNYRFTPQETTGQAPAELLLGRRPRSRLDAQGGEKLKKIGESESQS